MTMGFSIMGKGMRGAVGLALLVFLTALAAAGCARRAKQVEVKDAIDDYRVSKLFEVDGIKVYRFHDAGEWRYFASRGQTEYRVKHGKTTRPDGMVTVEMP